MCNLNLLAGSFVPTGHNVSNSLQQYLAYRQQGGAPNAQGFIAWRVAAGAKPNSANAEFYPLGPNQCNFVNLRLHDLDEITNRPNGFAAGRILHPLIQHPIQDCCQTIKCAYAVGIYRTAGFNNAQLLTDLQARQFAGTGGSASAILNVGQAFLRHFGLVDQSDLPNAGFSILFRC